MQKQAKHEFITIGILVAIVVVVVFLALLRARITVRDDLRVQDLTTLKQAVEQYYNTNRVYPTPPNKQLGCTNSLDLNSWIFGDQSVLLKGNYLDAIPHDVRESNQYYYSYCVVDIQDSSTTGYYVEARLEQQLEPHIGFDEDERRKFDYRIVADDDEETLYRVCGGTKNQCKPLGQSQ